MSKSFRKNLILFSLAVTILSQMPILRIVADIDTQLLSMPAWALVLAISLIGRKTFKFLRSTGFILSASIVFFLGISGLGLLNGNNYLSSTLIRPLMIAVFMLMIGVLNTDLFCEEFFKAFSRVFILTTIILCLDIYVEYFDEFTFDTTRYVFSAKNSAGQIIITAAVLVLYYKVQSKPVAIVKCALLIAFFVLTLMLRSRATIVSYAFIPLVFILKKKNAKRQKQLITIVLVAAAAIVLTNRNAYSFLVENILLNSNEAVDLSNLNYDQVTSTRYGSIVEAMALFKGKELWGIGAYYLDNFFVAAPLNFGIFFGGLLIVIAVWPLYRSSRIRKEDENIKLVLITLAVIYIFNGVFECLAPFGPGTKCFALWLLIGLTEAISLRQCSAITQ